ncbi:DUF4132 domain-containing protein [Actinosynnema sp. NPDC047251]|uniref:WGR domain-containing protein n=1 Tax=Saccharothrix espanaensis (strain ATCC 51144 / DSM 44229 / JCM 9112 / NBRC 15066 / NRRL 15764) TaxID=1179773 RepID=K0JT93_SACES|nr:DUF4132 domain-containing protein [Saccharothrix espanaensis]CCH31005.1 WGR domain-containing protein [Saccharothrix espanaensis DSM 44229]
MRRWELVGDGSAKFWEIGQAGATVTVRFGRIGTAGQTKVKDLASEAAATAHVTKLVAEKERKGYAEPAAAPSTTAAVAAGSPAVPAGATDATPVAAVVPGSAAPSAGSPDPATSAAVVPAADASAADASSVVVSSVVSSVVSEGRSSGVATADSAAPEVIEPSPAVEIDEDALVFPDRWRASVFPRRGGRLPSTVKPAPKAAGHLRASLAAKPEMVRAMLADRKTEPALAELLTEYLDGRVSPLGAAIAVAAQAHVHGGSPADEGRLVADDLVLSHGLPFAAEVAVSLGLVRAEWRTRLGDDFRSLLFTSRRHVLDHDDTPVVDRLRRLIAAGDEEAAVGAAVAALRTTTVTRMIASFLVPSRVDWVDEVLAEVTGNRDWASYRMLVCSASTEEHLAVITEHDQLAKELRKPAVLRTLVDALGPAVAPTLAELLDQTESYDRDYRKLLLETLAVLPSDAAFDLLVDRVDRPDVESALIGTAKRFPRRALRGLAARAGRPALKHLLYGHVIAHPGLVAELPEELRAAVAEVESEYREVAEIGPEGLPELLVTPPWTLARTAAQPVVVPGLEVPADGAVEWLPGEHEEWLATKETRFTHNGGAWHKLADALRQNKLSWHQELALVVHGPEDLVRPLLPEWRADYVWEFENCGRILVSRYGLDALPAVLHAVKGNPTPGHAELLMPFAEQRVAHLMADWLRLKTVRPVASAWLRRHADDAARYLAPTAVGATGPARRAAEAGLRVIPEQALAAAAAYGPEAAAAIDALVSLDPLHVLPAKLPVPGKWADANLLPQVLVAGRQRALPRTASAHVVMMLALSQPDAPYAGLDVVRELCDRQSLADFAWAAFERWRSVGMPAKDGWALTALALLGDDDAARGLAPLIKAWPGEAGHARAVAGLDVLAAIGTDAALIQLNGIALKSKFKGLKQRAQEKIAAVAAGRGLGAEQLADRLVPDFGLDDAATLTVDYGPRRFLVGFDEQLKPYVADADGKRRKDLPKPGAKDDPELAPAEHKRFAALKKDVRSVASDQIGRLETAMVMDRRWSAAEFRELFAGHPLLWHVVRRLVWTTSTGQSFRLAEDRTPATVEDDAFTLPDDAEVAIAHPLRLGAELAAWSEVFADYEILQPFPQLGRPVHRFTDQERTSSRLERFENVPIPVGRLLGLTKHGWRRGTPMDGGVECWMLRPLPGGGTVVANLDPGIAVGVVDMFPEQKLSGIWVDDGDGGDWSPRGSRRFGELDPVTASELLAELTSLTS